MIHQLDLFIVTVMRHLICNSFIIILEKGRAYKANRNFIETYWRSQDILVNWSKHSVSITSNAITAETTYIVDPGIFVKDN